MYQVIQILDIVADASGASMFHKHILLATVCIRNCNSRNLVKKYQLIS